VGSTSVDEPVGVLIVAVSVTGWFTTGETGDDANVVVAATWVTVSVAVLVTGPVKLLSPE